ncbi:hypothetical protein YC2023_080824 [Brassica napus]
MEKPPPRDQTGFEIDQSRFSNSPSGESLEYLALLRDKKCYKPLSTSSYVSAGCNYALKQYFAIFLKNGDNKGSKPLSTSSYVSAGRNYALKKTTKASNLFQHHHMLVQDTTMH